MSRMVEAVRDWARRTSTSFAELRDSGWRWDSESPIDDGLVYRLREWPTLPTSLRTAPVLRLLSLMSNRPVNRHWISTHTGLPASTIDALLQHLIAQSAVQVIDTNAYGTHGSDR